MIAAFPPRAAIISVIRLSEIVRDRGKQKIPGGFVARKQSLASSVKVG